MERFCSYIPIQEPIYDHTISDEAEVYVAAFSEENVTSTRVHDVYIVSQDI